MKPIARSRGLLALSNKRLRRARRLYFSLCRDAVMASTDNTVMHAMIRKMKERGLYAFPASDVICWRDYRYRIVRYLYKLHLTEIEKSPREMPCHWSFWYRGNGFDDNFSRVIRELKTA